MLSQMHDEFMWLNKPYNIMKNAIRVVTSLCSSGELPSLKVVKNEIVTNAAISKLIAEQ